jgi:hypothetical protein
LLMPHLLRTAIAISWWFVATVSCHYCSNIARLWTTTVVVRLWSTSIASKLKELWALRRLQTCLGEIRLCLRKQL